MRVKLETIESITANPPAKRLPSRGNVAALHFRGTGGKRAQAIAEAAAQRIVWINEELFDLRDKIRTTQERDHGALLLYLYNCGSGCLGCPHSRWLIWKNPTQIKNRYGQKASGKHNWNGYALKQPLKSIRKHQHSEKLVNLIRRAQNLINERHRLVKHVSNLAKSLRFQTK